MHTYHVLTPPQFRNRLSLMVHVDHRSPRFREQIQDALRTTVQDKNLLVLSVATQDADRCSLQLSKSILDLGNTLRIKKGGLDDAPLGEGPTYEVVLHVTLPNNLAEPPTTWNFDNLLPGVRVTPVQIRELEH